MNTPGESKTDEVHVLLVHGAWADGSAWSKIIPPLIAAGLHVVAVQLALSSLDDDVATLRRAMRATEGAILLVGHSYGGVVITQAGVDPRVSGLVYVAAFAPDAGESLASFRNADGPAPLQAHIRRDPEGFLTLTQAGFTDVLAHDATEDETATICAVQKPISENCLRAAVTAPAWRTRPCVFLVTTSDRSFTPDLQRAMAAKMEAETTEVPSSHFVILSHPDVIARTIIRAAARLCPAEATGSAT